MELAAEVQAVLKAEALEIQESALRSTELRVTGEQEETELQRTELGTAGQLSELLAGQLSKLRAAGLRSVMTAGQLTALPQWSF